MDLSDGKDRYVELELPPGSLTVRVIPPEGVEIPTQLAVGLHPVDPLEARSRDHLKFAPIRDGELAQFDSVPAGEYVLRVGEEIFQPFLLSKTEVTCSWLAESRGSLSLQFSFDCLLLPFAFVVLVDALIEDVRDDSQGELLHGHLIDFCLH